MTQRGCPSSHYHGTSLRLTPRATWDASGGQGTNPKHNKPTNHPSNKPPNHPNKPTKHTNTQPNQQTSPTHRRNAMIWNPSANNLVKFELPLGFTRWNDDSPANASKQWFCNGFSGGANGLCPSVSPGSSGFLGQGGLFLSGACVPRAQGFRFRSLVNKLWVETTLQTPYILKTQLFNFLGSMGYVCKRLTSPGQGVLRGKTQFKAKIPLNLLGCVTHGRYCCF